MGVGEGEQKGVELQEAEEGVSGGHWYMDEEFDSFGFNIVRGFNLEEVRGMVDQEPHLVLGGPVDNGVEDFFDGLRGHQVHGKAV